MHIKDAKAIAFGSRESASLTEYYDAWQWLYDNAIPLRDPDINYLDKLICDGIIKPKDGYF